ncbi:glycoside hydrolase family 36 protein [Amnibacterium setariae]|uniref:Alpha-galactosidase n=1 Tax=Amnibacterium setariae TaxID=2306585 RepID=A0A3A1TZX5_9MICO|nr:glycoside hydrolase family 36 protein [Amnibacterium setariae]RIX27766.1 alpha-galactosidase [Amnibacterium setariae]
MHAEARFPDLAVPVRAAGPLTRLGLGWLVPPGPVAVLHPFDEGASFYRHGWNSWSPSGWRRLTEPPLRIGGDPARLLTADDAANDTPLAHSGSAVGALEGPDGRVLLLGALGLGTPRVGADRHVLHGTTEDAGDGWFLAWGREDEVFGAYAALLAERLGGRDRRAGAVWSSWYSYYEDVDEDLLARTVEDLRGHPIDVVQLDDGWEAAVGDWTANDRFPSGMAATASRIAAAGFRPGLWLAPLIALPRSRFARDHPELLVQDDDGRPLVTGTNWGTGYFALDTTRPEALDHLADVVRRAVADGFTYLKLDFLYAGAVRGRRSRDLPRERVYRDAVEHVRRAAGDDVHLLGCGAPMLPSAGVFDGVRVGPDTAAFWDNGERRDDPSGSGARNAIAASIPRTWLRPLYELDPDAVYFRRRRSLLDEPQRQLVEDAATVLGFRQTSDPMAWLDAGERDELDAWLRAPPAVERFGRTRWRVDGREVDFAPVLDGSAPASPATLVE